MHLAESYRVETVVSPWILGIIAASITIVIVLIALRRRKPRS